MIDFLLNKAKDDVQHQYECLNITLNDETGKPIGSFIARVIEWRSDDRSQLLWEMFNEAIDMSHVGFMGSFNSFVVNCLLDDSAFRVEYRIPDYKCFDLQWLPGGGIKTVLSTKDNNDSQPVIVWDNDGSSDVGLLMEAMDHKERGDKKRRESFVAFQNNLASLMKGNTV